MLWKFRKSSITIPAELHQKILESCSPMFEGFSEVTGVRSRATSSSPKEDGRSETGPSIAGYEKRFDVPTAA